MLIATLLTAALALGQDVVSAESGPTNVARIELSGFVNYIDEVKLPARQAGVLVELKARRGAHVQVGDIAARIDQRDAGTRRNIARYEHEHAQAEATNEIRVEAADASAKVAASKLDRKRAIERRTPGTITAAELEELELSLKHAQLQALLARKELLIASFQASAKEAELEMAQRDFDDRVIKSNIDGVVVEQLKYEDEWVQQGEPIIRILRMDRLKVEVFLPAHLFDPREIAGSPALLEINLARDKMTEPIKANVDYVGSEIEPNGSMRIWAEFQNVQKPGADGRLQWVVKPGMNADVNLTITVNGKPPVIPLSMQPDAE